MSRKEPIWPFIQPEHVAQALALQYELEDIETWPQAKLAHHQLQQLQRLLRHSLSTVPYYQGLNYRPLLTRFVSASELALSAELYTDLPLIDRTTIQQNLDRLITKGLPEEHGNMFTVKSSGSTGTPVEARSTNLSSVMNMAMTMRGHRWHNRDICKKNLDIRGPWDNGPPPPSK
ncbi:MAG: hypothetical protein ACR2OR_14170, partial [Hyphomicrobiales bacterium]